MKERLLINRALIRFSDLIITKTAPMDRRTKILGRFRWHITVPRYTDAGIVRVTVSGKTLQEALNRLLRKAANGTLDT